MSEVAQAVKILVKALKEDPMYRMGWQANIAMAFKDEWSRSKRPVDIHVLANRAADSFLSLLCREVE